MLASGPNCLIPCHRPGVKSTSRVAFEAEDLSVMLS